MTNPPPRVGFVLELSLGHGTHAENLQRLLPSLSTIRPEIRTVSHRPNAFGSKVPFYRDNWTVNAGLQSVRAIAAMRRTGRLDALFIHTQVPAVLSQPWMMRIPTVVSFDATPLQFDEFADQYQHLVGGPRSEWLRFRANRSCLNRSVHLVAWSAWAKQGVVDGYEVPDDKVTVVSPGVVPALWCPPADRRKPPGPLRILFVGGDFRRKGGEILLEAFAAVRASCAAQSDGQAVSLPELHLVTSFPVGDHPGVYVHTGLLPNSHELIALYHSASVFCLPTLADCLGLVLAEAGAAGLPLVATAVGGLAEIVRHDETGILIPPNDVEALTGALSRLVADEDLRRRLGLAAQRLVADRHDATVNAARLAELTVEHAARHSARPRR